MRLQIERVAAGLSQGELSRLSGVPQSTISKIEAGLILFPTYPTLDRLARTLQKFGRSVDPGDLQPTPRPKLVARRRRRAVA